MKTLSILLLFQDVSGGELILILLAIFLLFGPNKIPEIAKGLAKGLNKIKNATSDIREEVNKTIDPIKKELQGNIDSVKEDLNLGNNQEVHGKPNKPIVEKQVDKDDKSAG